MKPCISQATTLPAPFADDVAAYADAGCQALKVWPDQAGDAPGTEQPGADPTFAGRAQDDAWPPRLTREAVAVPGRTAAGPLRSLQAPA